MMNFDPVDEYEAVEKFQKDMASFGENFRFQEPNWRPSKIDAFKIVTENEISKHVLFGHKVDYEIIRNDKNECVLKITVRTKNWGQLTVQIPLEYLLSDKCPKELPSQLAIGFKNKFEIKQKKLIQDLQKNGEVL